MSVADFRWLKRRNSVEPIIGHLKSDGKMARCYLKGVLGDAINALLCAAGQNLRRLLRQLYFGPILRDVDAFWRMLGQIFSMTWLTCSRPAVNQYSLA